MSRSAAISMGAEKRSVKPSAQPTLVRTQHLPPPAKTAPWLRKRGPAGRFLLVTMCISTCHYGSMHGSVRVHMVYSARVELAVRITARCADLRPFCPLTPAPGALARLLSAAHKAGWLSSVMPVPSGWLGLPARCGRADGWIVPRHMAWLSLQAVARRRAAAGAGDRYGVVLSDLG